MQDNDIAVSTCAACGYKMDRASDIAGDATPSPGDWSICYKCAAVGVFEKRDDGSIGIRALTDEDVIPFEVVSASNKIAYWRVGHPYEENRDGKHRNGK